MFIAISAPPIEMLNSEENFRKLWHIRQEYLLEMLNNYLANCLPFQFPFDRDKNDLKTIYFL